MVGSHEVLGGFLPLETVWMSTPAWLWVHAVEGFALLDG